MHFKAEIKNQNLTHDFSQPPLPNRNHLAKNTRISNYNTSIKTPFEIFHTENIPTHPFFLSFIKTTDEKKLISSNRKHLDLTLFTTSNVGCNNPTTCKYTQTLTVSIDNHKSHSDSAPASETSHYLTLKLAASMQHAPSKTLRYLTSRPDPWPAEHQTINEHARHQFSYTIVQVMTHTLSTVLHRDRNYANRSSSMNYRRSTFISFQIILR